MNDAGVKRLILILAMVFAACTGAEESHQETIYTNKHRVKSISHANILNFNARWYDGLSGQFITPDPIRQEDLNYYTYVNNNPLKYIDPTGQNKRLPSGVTLPSALQRELDAVPDAMQDVFYSMFNAYYNAQEKARLELNQKLTEIKDPSITSARRKALKSEIATCKAVFSEAQMTFNAFPSGVSKAGVRAWYSSLTTIFIPKQGLRKGGRSSPGNKGGGLTTVVLAAATLGVGNMLYNYYYTASAMQKGLMTPPSQVAETMPIDPYELEEIQEEARLGRIVMSSDASFWGKMKAAWTLMYLTGNYRGGLHH